MGETNKSKRDEWMFFVEAEICLDWKNKGNEPLF